MIATSNVVTALAATAAREDPAQDELRLIIIGLVSLAAVLLVITVVLWRMTRPDRTIGESRADPSADPETERAAPETEPAPMSEPAPTSEPLPAVGSPDAPWPPPKVARLGSVRPPRQPDAEGTVLSALASIPDLETIAPEVPTMRTLWSAAPDPGLRSAEIGTDSDSAG